MIALIQRVSSAKVDIEETTIGAINNGILLFLGVEKTDARKQTEQLLHKVINHRIFEDGQNKMNLSLLDVSGELMIISQFTLAADTNKGLRPSFTPAAPPEQGKELYEYFIQLAKQKIAVVESGKFGADMQISLINDGPNTFWLQIK